MSFKIIITRLKYIFIDQNRNHENQHIFSSEKFAYSYSVKIYASGFNKLLERIFCLLLVMEAFSLQKVFQMLEVVVSWQEVR